MARLQGLQAQHTGTHQDACDQFEAGVAEGVKILCQNQESGMQWLLQDLLAGLQLEQAETYCCMVDFFAPIDMIARPFISLLLSTMSLCLAGFNQQAELCKTAHDFAKWRQHAFSAAQLCHLLCLVI